MEPAHNSCDWYHFKTVHSVMCQHWRSFLKILQIENWSPPARCMNNNSVDDDGTALSHEVIITDQYTKRASIFGIRLPQWFVDRLMVTQVRFCGCMLGSINMKFPLFGRIYTIVTMTPAGPFDTHMELHSFSSWWTPRVLTWIMTYVFQ